MLKKGDILLHGHTHVPVSEEFDGRIYLNPGSVSIPKWKCTQLHDVGRRSVHLERPWMETAIRHIEWSYNHES